jgi:hypothetical protein
MVTSLRVKGDKELERAFLELRREVLTELRPAMRKIGEGVRTLAEQKAGADIANIGSQWGRMRIGVTTRMFYVAPRSRNHGGSKRPNLAGLLMQKAMVPAADEKRTEMVAAVDALVKVSAHRNGF